MPLSLSSLYTHTDGDSSTSIYLVKSLSFSVSYRPDIYPTLRYQRAKNIHQLPTLKVLSFFVLLPLLSSPGFNTGDNIFFDSF